MARLLDSQCFDTSESLSKVLNLPWGGVTSLSAILPDAGTDAHSVGQDDLEIVDTGMCQEAEEHHDL